MPVLMWMEPAEFRELSSRDGELFLRDWLHTPDPKPMKCPSSDSSMWARTMSNVGQTSWSSSPWASQRSNDGRLSLTARSPSISAQMANYTLVAPLDERLVSAG